jgi:predicted ribosome quality control (RQC) complex YloA/Tae2 family protein
MSSLSKVLKKAERSISKLIPHQHSADIRAANAATKAQLDYYQEAKDTMHKQNEEIAQEKAMESQKIHEKQIRAMRNKFRSPGFLGTDTDSNPDTLG